MTAIGSAVSAIRGNFPGSIISVYSFHFHNITINKQLKANLTGILLMRDYQQGKIYELVCRVTGKRYIGSTTQELSQRFYGHKNRLNKCSSKEIVEAGDCYINLIRACPVNSRSELLAEERLEYDRGNCVNKFRPMKTDEEHRTDGARNTRNHRARYPDTTRACAMRWRTNNREAYNEYQRNYQKEWRARKNAAIGVLPVE